jgi:hypothetical protein
MALTSFAAIISPALAPTSPQNPKEAFSVDRLIDGPDLGSISQRSFSPFSMRGTTIDNRTVVSPMCEYSAVDGDAQDWHLMHLGQYAVSGIGLVITEAAAVEPRGRITSQCLGQIGRAHV